MCVMPSNTTNHSSADWSIHITYFEFRWISHILVYDARSSFPHRWTAFLSTFAYRCVFKEYKYIFVIPFSHTGMHLHIAVNYIICVGHYKQLSTQRPGSPKNTTQHHDVSVQSTLDRRPMYYSQKNVPVESECKRNNVNPHIIRNQ